MAKEDFSRAHVDGAEELFASVRNSGLDFNSARLWGNILRYMFVCQSIEAAAYTHGKETIRILDIGCSEATMYGFIARNFQFYGAKKIEYVGVDVRQSSLDAARALYGDEITLVNLDLNEETKLHEFFSEPFDVISAQQVLEHVGYDDAIEMLKSCNKLLVDAGQLVISAPNPRKHLGENFISSNTGPGQFGRHAHIYEFSFDELEPILKDTGFHITDHLGAITRAMPWSVENLEQDELPIGEMSKKFSYGFFTAMISANFPKRSKNYLIKANKHFSIS